MNIKKIEFKNFASYGNITQTIDLENNNDMILLTGQNGGGKSSLSVIIKYLLYGKTDTVNLGDLPNRVNKNALGKITFEVKGKTIQVSRGIQPGSFEIFENGVEYDQAGKTNKQEYLEREYLQIPFHVFANTIILSINDFKSFITMSPYDKRRIIDKLFGFGIINEMRERIKSERKVIKESSVTLEKELNLIINSINSINNKIVTLEKDLESKLNLEIDILKTELLNLVENRKSQILNLDKIKLKYSSIYESHRLSSESYNLVSSEISSIESNLKQLGGDVCPICKSDLHQEEHVEYINGLNDKLKLLKESKIDLTEQIKSLKLDLDRCKKFQSDLSEQINKLNYIIENKTDNLKKALSKSNSSEFEQLQNLIIENSKLKETKLDVKLELDQDDHFLDLLENKVLSDTGIKNLAIKTILPSLNQNIKALSEEIHLPFQFKFNEAFECEIKQWGYDVNIKSLSTGEKKKADFIVIIAIIQLIKLKYPSINILFLDEIFASIDQEGIYNILNILNRVIKNIGLNTFVINHSELPVAIFDKKIEVYKNEGFSKLNIERLK